MKGFEIKNLRLKLGLSQEEFGQILGYQKPQVRVSELENGKKEVSNQIVAACRLIEENRLLKEKLQSIINISQ
ncbi:helix-turn-helix domain-containing protein [Spirosoma pollinicola]|nr:helix-turn-helix domain-containing protein [Spirosoma pollinicola]